MDISKVENAIHALIEHMAEPSTNNIAKLQSYGAIRAICLDIEDHTKTSDTYTTYLDENIHGMLWSCQTLAGLDNGNNHSVEQHVAWAIGKRNVIIELLKHGIKA
jgi:hypothetical protein